MSRIKPKTYKPFQRVGITLLLPLDFTPLIEKVARNVISFQKALLGRAVPTSIKIGTKTIILAEGSLERVFGIGFLQIVRDSFISSFVVCVTIHSIFLFINRLAFDDFPFLSMAPVSPLIAEIASVGCGILAAALISLVNQPFEPGSADKSPLPKLPARIPEKQRMGTSPRWLDSEEMLMFYLPFPIRAGYRLVILGTRTIKCVIRKEVLQFCSKTFLFCIAGVVVMRFFSFLGSWLEGEFFSHLFAPMSLVPGIAVVVVVAFLSALPPIYSKSSPTPDSVSPVLDTKTVINPQVA